MRMIVRGTIVHFCARNERGRPRQRCHIHLLGRRDAASPLENQFGRNAAQVSTECFAASVGVGASGRIRCHFPA